MYGLDLMGSWGGDGDWTGDHNWGNEDYGQRDNGQLRSLKPGCSLSLAMPAPAPLAISDRYSGIAEASHTAIGVTLDKRIVAKPRKLPADRARLKNKFKDVHNVGCARCPFAETPKLLHSTWAKRNAIVSYENFMNCEYGMDLEWASGVDEVAATSLGVEGWALYDVATFEEPWTSPSTSSSAYASSTGAGTARPACARI